MAGHSIRDIAAALNAEAFGALDIVVTGVAEPAKAGPMDLAMAMRPGYAAALAQGAARAAVIGAGMDWQALGLEAAILAPRLVPGPPHSRAASPSPDPWHQPWPVRPRLSPRCRARRKPQR
jgi:UDP-3-O-[3-hydroxymyristoyl] glucosamine N-acyltransferase